MTFAKFAAAAALAAATLSTAGWSQVVAGTNVYGPEGGEVGTIVSVENGVVTVNTGTHTAPLPENAFGKSDKGPTISVTKAQLDAMVVEQAAAATAARDTALVAGAAVVSPKGAALGTIKSVEGDAVVLESPAGPVQLKREHFALDAQGALTALFTAEQVAAAAASGNAAK